MPTIRIRHLENGHLAFGLIDLLEAIGDAAAESIWRCAVEDFVPGESTKYLPAAYEVAEHGISDALLRQIGAHTQQVIDGTFNAFRPNQKEPWLSFRAVDRSWWEISAPATKRRCHSARGLPRWKAVHESRRNSAAAATAPRVLQVRYSLACGCRGLAAKRWKTRVGAE